MRAFLLHALLSAFIMPIAAHADCPILASRGWHAWVDDHGTDGETRLLVFGQIDLPSPGHGVAWRTGPLDRMQPPSQRITLNVSRPEGMVAQVITPRDTLIDLPTKIAAFRSVVVVCGEEVLAEIPDVGRLSSD